MLLFADLAGPVAHYFAVIFQFWWIWLAPLSVTTFVFTFLAWRRALYKNKIQWTMLELRFPRAVERSPKAMEQFLATIYGVKNQPGDFMDKYKEGEVRLWFSLEIVSLEGEIHFYIRTPSKHRRVVEGNLYAHYPMIDIQEVSDYMDAFAPTVPGLYGSGYEIWGAEMQFAKEDAYPIRTYVQFENLEESMSLDPIGGLLEVLSRIGKGENICLQFLIRPADDGWKKKADELIEELKTKGQKTVVSPIGEYTDRPIRTPGETQLMKTIDEKAAKSGFDTLIRYIYISKPEVTNLDYARRAILSSFNQYSSQDMNSFKRNPAASTDVKWTYFPWVFVASRLEARKRRMYHSYRLRRMPEESDVSKVLSAHFLHFNFAQQLSILNTEELATLFHPPTNIVLTGPLLDRVSAKKMGPPSGLPIYGEEEK